MKYLLLLLLLTGNLFAGDSGSYYNPERDGEGLQLTRNGDRVQFFFYTYDDHQGCYGIDIPDGGLVTEDNCHENRWFYSDANLLDKTGDYTEGWLFTGLGTGYSKCIPDPVDPFLSVCGEGHIVGRFLMERSKTGWRMIVIHFGDLLDKEDSLYGQIFDFNTLLFEATD